MVANLSYDSEGNAMFAYNDREDPWHRLGTSVAGYMTADEALLASHCAWDVEYMPIYLQTASGLQQIEGVKSTVRKEMHLTDDGFSERIHVLGPCVGQNYQADQNAETTQWAFDLAGASGGDAAVDTMGALGNGVEFFVGLDLGTLVLDPEGIKDNIKQYLVARNRHDGTLSLQAFTTHVRVVCQNTLTLAAGRADRTIKIKHTSHKDDRKIEAIEVMGLARKMREQFVERANALIATPAGPNALMDVAKKLWTPPDADATDRARTMWNNRFDTLLEVWERPTNAPNYGGTAWTVYNTFGEYLDWDRATRGKNGDVRLAEAAADPLGQTASLKAKVAELLLVG